MTAERSFVLKGFCPYDILALYDEFGLDVGKHLRGDFCIEIKDGNKTIYITDFAGTKCAGKLPRNSTIVVEDNRIISFTHNISVTDLYYNPPQGKRKKDNYDDFFNVLDEAIYLRHSEDTTVYLSSGVDSGAIATGCIRNNLKFKSLSIMGESGLAEDGTVLRSRLSLINDFKILWKECAPENLVLNEKTGGHEYLASNTSSKVVLSGLGADEYYHSTDYELASIFLKDSGVIYDNYNLDIRYPLLDPNVFKEFFYLKKSLRIKPQKRPFVEYMLSIGFPVYLDKKISLNLE